MTTERTYEGGCFCGAVRLKVVGEPVAMGYCHCASCRSWSAGPVNAFSLWKPQAITVTQGANQIGTFAKTPASERKWCTRCGGHLMTAHPAWNLVDVYAATIPAFQFEPAVHVHYNETVLHMPDGLPKMKDIPAEMGGSGITLPD
jgi:hypothetical protein